jgi:hypothetical protein
MCRADSFRSFCHLKTASQVNHMTIEELELKFKEFLKLRSAFSKNTKREKIVVANIDLWRSMRYLDSSLPEENPPLHKS